MQVVVAETEAPSYWLGAREVEYLPGRQPTMGRS